VELEVSSMHVAGISDTAVKLGFAGVLASLKPQVRESLEAPYGRRWHPGTVMFDFSDALAAAHGLEALEQHSYELTRSSFGPVLRPLLSVALALMGGNPSALFDRLGDAMGLAMRGVRVKWRAEERCLSVQYPLPLPEAALASWSGVARFLFELAKQPEGRVVEHAFSADKRTIMLTLWWPSL
jgi:hypothetical protein